MAVIYPQTGTAGAKKSAIGLGAQYQVEHTDIDDLPFADGDITYTAAYEYHDMGGCWQLMVGYTPDITGTNNADYAITPQLNLIMQDKIFLGGVGVLGSYIESTDTGGDWTDVYWQMMLGLEVPIGPVKLEAMAYYQFSEWSDFFSGFEFDELVYGGSLKYYF